MVEVPPLENLRRRDALTGGRTAAERADEDHGRADPLPAKSRLNAHAHLHQPDERGAGGAGDTPPKGAEK